MIEGLEVSQNGALLSVELANKPNNEFTKEMCIGLTSLLRDPPSGAKVMVISAQGDKFCTGRDRSGQSPREIREMGIALAEVNIALVYSKLVVISKVSGDAAGFGVGLVGLADVAIASREAHFCFPEVRGGLAPALVLTWLPYVVGRRASFWMTSTGANIDAEEACRLGLINQVVDASELDEKINLATETMLAAPDEVCSQIKADLINREWLTMKEDSYASVERLSLRSLIIAGERYRES